MPMYPHPRMGLPFTITVPSARDGRAPPWDDSRTFSTADPVSDSIGADPRRADLYAEAYMSSLDGEMVQALSTTPNPRMVILNLNPILYWPLDALFGMQDQSGNGHHGTGRDSIVIGGLADSPLSTNTTCTQFNGTGQTVRAAGWNPYTNGSSLTFCGWAMQEASAGIDTIFSSNSSAEHPRLRINSGSNDLSWNPDNTGGSASTYADAWPGPDRWVHWAISFNESTDACRLYIDGSLYQANSNSSSYDAVPGDFQVAASSTSANVFGGRMAEVAIFDTILSDADVASIYDSAFA